MNPKISMANFGYRPSFIFNKLAGGMVVVFPVAIRKETGVGGCKQEEFDIDKGKRFNSRGISHFTESCS
jgi:hypothetical protein